MGRSRTDPIVVRARVTVHGELSDHLSLERRGGAFRVELEIPASLRDLLQSTGIPHVEVGMVEVEGVTAPWELRVDHDVAIEAWPRYPLLEPEPDPRFVLDVHLGKLARLLRLLGFDALRGGEAGDDEFAREAAGADRILLSRDRGLLMRGALRRGRWIRGTDPEDQATEVLDRFCLNALARPFSRCMECNAPLVAADAGTVDVPSGVRQRHHDFRRCPGCRRVYWSGSHVDRLASTVGRLLHSDPSGDGAPRSQ